jgi:tetratricopeptide (TPR) repeat protein
VSDTDTSVQQLFEQACILRIDGQYAEAIEVLSRVIDAEPNFAHAHMELGLSLCFIGEFDRSLTELELAAGLASTDAEIHLHLGKTYTMLGYYDEGLLMFQKVLELAIPDDRNYAEAEKQLSYYASTPGSMPAAKPTGDTSA